MFHFKTLYWICSIKNQRADSLEKMLVLGKIDGKRRRGQQRMRQIASPTQRTWTWANSERVWKTEEPGGLQSMGSQRVGHNLATEQQQIELVTPIASTLCFFFFFFFGCKACGILAPSPGNQTRTLCIARWSFNYWTTRKFLGYCFLNFCHCIFQG